MKDFPNMSQAERQVMRVVWAKKQTTSATIITALEEAYQWSGPTIKTLINRLLKKGYLEATSQGRSFLYSPTISEQEMIHRDLNNLLDNLCHKKNGQVVADMIALAQLSQEDIHHIQAVLDQKAQTAPQFVSCNCIPGQCSCGHGH